MTKIDGVGLGYSYHLPTAGWSLRIRNSLLQFSDLFSEFNKYIAPAYHHDRCERSVQMRLYSMHKREFVMIIIAFFGCFGLAMFIGLAGPPITSTTEVDGKSLLPKDNHSNLSDIATGPFIMRTPAMSTYSQQLWVIAKLATDNSDDKIFDKSFQVSVGIDGLTEGHKPVTVLSSSNSKNRTRHLRCVKQECDEFIVLHLGFLDYTHYIIAVRFYDLESFHQRYIIKELTFYFKTYNAAFTQIEIWFSFIFLLSTFIIACWFAHTLRKYTMFDWSIEQKWMSILLPLLLFYNNPIFPMMFLTNSWIPGMVDAIGQATFLCGLLLFWLCVYHGLRQNERKFLSFYFPKVFVVGMLWLSAIIMATWEKCKELKDPTYNHAVDTYNYYTLKVFFFTSGGIYLAYLLLLLLRAYSELRSMPFFDTRLKFLTLLMLVVLTISLIITVLRFGVGVLEDNFEAQLSTHYTSSAQFMSFYGLLNFYVYTMAYVYSPGNRPIHVERLSIEVFVLDKRNMTKIDGVGLGYSYHLPTAGWSLRIRNSLSQFSDLFSEFNKYIAPAYHHDRCERSVQMRLYSMHKREFVMIIIAFFGCFGLAMFIGLAGPPITSTTEVDGKSLLPKDNHSNPSDIATGPFMMRTPAMSTYSQQLWVIAKLATDNSDDEIFDKSFQVSVGIDGLTEEHKPVTVLSSSNSKNRTRHLRCVKQECDEFIVLHLGFLDYTHYIITVRFYDLESFHQRYNIKELTFYFKTYNAAFTQIEIWFRFIFLLSTFIIACWFAHTLRKYTMFDWSIEQKWMSILLPLLLFYNNPIFPMMFLINSWIPGMIDAIGQATFLCGLLLFWLCVYHGLRQNERKFLSFYFPKVFVVGMLWLSAIIMATWEKCNELEDPTYNHAVDTYNYYTLKVFFFTSGGIYLAYLLLLLLRAYSELRSMPFFDKRLKFLTLLMLVVLTISLIITVLRFGVGVLEDNFVAQLSTHYNSSAQFMSFYGLLNFYVYTMAYVYSPGNRPIHETSITKDNPAFSMINDSDEDVIYGSDEESRRPLNRSRNDDDSD